MGLSRDEMETVIRCSAADKSWDIVTADPRVKTRLRRAGYEGKPDHQLSAPYEKFEVPFKLVRFGSRKAAEARRERGLLRMADKNPFKSKSVHTEAGKTGEDVL